METELKKRGNDDQVTFKDKEIRALLLKFSEDTDKAGIGPKAKALIKEALAARNAGKETQEINENSLKTSSEKRGLPTIPGEIKEELLSKLEFFEELLSKIVVILKDNKDSEEETQIAQEIQTAVEDREDELRSEHLMLRLNSKQRALFIKLFEFKKEKGEDFTERSEDLFVLMFWKTFIAGWFESTPDGFIQDFVDAFPEYFEKIEGQKIAQPEVKPTEGLGPSLEPQPGKIILPISERPKDQLKDLLAKVMTKHKLTESEALDYCVKYTAKNDWL